MRKWIVGALALSLSWSASAQELPQPSPTATLSQRVGLTDFEVVYSRPSAKGRTIFGDLVPYGQVWRTGANACTILSSSSDFKLGGETIKAGKYALFTIPGETEWTIIVSTQTNLWGNSGYDASNDVARFKVMPMESDFDESFAIDFDAFTTNSAKLIMEWENTAVAIPVEVDSDAESAKNVAQAISDAKRSYRNAADFYSKAGEHEKAIEMINTALELDPSNWYTNWVKAQVLAAAGEKKEAKKQGKKAIEMGQEAYDSMGRVFTYRAGLEKDMKSWK
jgi:tetratricopeptide (TPR) repeat protein